MTVPIRCPSCDARVEANLTVADGGEPPATDEIHGKDLSCACCGSEFELLYYPS